MDKKLAALSLILVVLTAPLWAEAAVLYLIPQSQTVYQGDSFIVGVNLDTEGEEINSAGIGLVFPDLLEVVDFNTGNSIFSLWPKSPSFQEQKIGDKQEGLISLVGGTPQGFKGKGLILNITFRAKETGKVSVNFQKDSKVLLNDGKGTETELIFLEGNYEIMEKPEGLPPIFSGTHPDQNKWYAVKTFRVRWNPVEGVEYSYLLSLDPLAIPDEILDRPEGELMWIGEMEYADLEDGIYYFHLRQATGSKEQGLVWEPKTTFRFMIDSEQPKEFEPKIGQDKTVFEGRYFLSFASRDEMSGIEHYEVLETKDGGLSEWKKGDSPYLLEDQTLESIIKVKATDKAGNERIFEILPSKKPFPYQMILIVFSWSRADLVVLEEIHEEPRI